MATSHRIPTRAAARLFAPPYRGQPESFTVVAHESVRSDDAPEHVHLFEFSRLRDALDLALRWHHESGKMRQVEVWLEREMCIFDSELENGELQTVWTMPATPGRFAYMGERAGWPIYENAGRADTGCKA